MTSPIRRASAGFVAVALAFGLTVAACGGSSEEEATEETTTEEVAEGGTEGSESGGEISNQQAFETLTAEELLENGFGAQLQNPEAQQALCSAPADQRYTALVQGFVRKGFEEAAVQEKLTEEKVNEFFETKCAQ